MRSGNTAESHVYDEFYHFTDQIGIRFGNGDFGKILPQGTKVRVELVLTEGDTILLEKQSLWPVEEIRDANGLSAQYQITVSQTIQNGEAQEGTEEMRRNLHYAPVYNERLVWDNDYEYFLRRRFPEIVFTRAWGEEEAEKQNLDLGLQPGERYPRAGYEGHPGCADDVPQFSVV